MPVVYDIYAATGENIRFFSSDKVRTRLLSDGIS